MGQPDDIRRYLDENGATYTPEAIRTKLLEAGYADADIDAALVEWKAARSGSEADLRTFRRWAIWFHLGALAAMVIVVLVLKGAGNGGVVVIGAAILAVALLIGWWLSSLIGRALLPRSGVTLALIAPLISALVLGGTCVGLMNAVIPTPPLDGTADLELTAPEPFGGSGGAACYLREETTFQVISHTLGALDGREMYFAVSGNRSELGWEITITLSAYDPGGGADDQNWGTTPEATLEATIVDNGAAGEVAFEGLPPSDEGANQGLEPASGSFTWTCEG